MQMSLKDKKGFTVTELMIVVAIIGILAALAIPQFQKYRRRAVIGDVIALASQIVAYEDTYYSLNSSYKALNIASSSSQQVYSDNVGGKIVIPSHTSVTTTLTTCSLTDISSGATSNQPGFNATIVKNNAPGGALTVVYNSCKDSRPHPL